MRKDEEIILALDSTSVPLTAVLKKGGKVYCARRAGIKQEDYLFPLLGRLLAKAGCKLGDVKKFFFLKGPGRFTGIRISITLASLLHEISGVEISSADVFDVLAAEAQKSRGYKKWLAANPRGAAAVVLHAFRDEYFVKIYAGPREPRWLGGDDLPALLKAARRPLYIIGRGRDGAPLQNLLPPCFAYAPARLNKITARALPAFDAPPQSIAKTLEPLYLKPARFELGK
ncbi:MAG: tRNA (adenosine(37)-N6)-threonylcarbamoyltransferase complex dimerization subunit type 1 TsaB [Elusimicrobiota bacterium]|jgi:tRNA threonylcarbamoyl adenosine modification protein YeaZ|nr:tRNA (adenosine(37)-N6)-threonylcarbamoyltransferase complex dimerization subunit type 1 TsaB [Elusimicrobiota bacterium]